MRNPIGPQRTVPSTRREETCDGTAVIVARNLPADKTTSELCEFLEESSGLTPLHVSLHARPKTFFEGSTSTLSTLTSSEDAAAVRIERMEDMIRGPAVNARVTPGGWHHESFAVLEVCNAQQAFENCDKIAAKFLIKRGLAQVQQDAASVILASCQGATFHGMKIMLHLDDVFGPRLQQETQSQPAWPSQMSFISSPLRDDRQKHDGHILPRKRGRPQRRRPVVRALRCD
jgi:hypothetical protein